MLVTTQCASYCRYCTRSRIVGDPTQNFNSRRARGAARLPAPYAAGARRAHQRRRRPDARAQAVRDDHPRPARDPAHRDHPHRLARAGLHAAARRRRAVRDARQVPPDLDEPALQPSQRDHARGRAGRRQAHPRGHSRGQSVGPAGRRQRLRQHPARPRPPAGRDARPAVLHLPVRPGRGLGPLPHAGRQGPRDHGGPARPHLRLRGPDLRDRRARRWRQDPGHAQLPDQLLRPQGRAAQLRGLHHDLRGAARLRAARQVALQGVPVGAARARPVGRARPARGRADVDRADQLCRGPLARQRRAAPAPAIGQVDALWRRRDRGHGACGAAGPAAPRRPTVAAATNGKAYAPGEEPRPRDGEPTGSAHGELL